MCGHKRDVPSSTRLDTLPCAKHVKVRSDLQPFKYLQQLHELEDEKCLHQNKDVGSQVHVQLVKMDTMCYLVLSFRSNIVRWL